MEKTFIDRFLIINGKKLPSHKLLYIAEKMESSNLPPSLVNLNFMNPILATILYWVLFPLSIIDRLILGDWIWGLIKLFLPIVCYIFYENPTLITYNYETASTISGTMFFIIIPWIIWCVVDAFTIYSRTKWANYRALKKAFNI